MTSDRVAEPDDPDDLDLTVQVISFIVPPVLTILGVTLLIYALYGALL
ncbi:hypothetical protein [Corynebacterium glutamicum]|nr:hypothetical protein [Corynebacterium glutamicum]